MSRSHRKIWVVAPIALVVGALNAAAAGANPLLSGYGGPGQGEQAVIGSALLNVPRGGSGSSSGGAGTAEPGAAALTASAGSTAAGAAATAGSKPSGGTGRSRQAGRATGGQHETKTGSEAAVPGGGLARDAAYATTGSGGTLGLSGGDIVYLLLALSALALTGGLTRQLVRGGRTR